ncbi:MAG: hypothetical protein WCJ42_08715 [Actinomycetes bacterium]
MASEAVTPAGWVLTLCPAAREAGGSFHGSVASTRGGWASEPDPERARLVAAQRARRRFRLYVVANQLTRLGTLTYPGEGCWDQGQLRADVGEFFRAVRSMLGGQPIPYVWVPEWHKKHGLHAHFLLGRFVRRSVIIAAWKPAGWVGIELVGDLPVGSGTFAEARRAAHYGAKYLKKAFADERIAKRHRYDVAQGFQPVFERINRGTLERGLAECSRRLDGNDPAVVFRPDQEPGFTGPPSVWAQWN